MTDISHGDIYLIQFDPSTGHEYQKTRPAVVISSNDILQRSSFVTCVPLTSRVSRPFDDDILIARDSENNLFSDSLLKSQHISTFDQSRVEKYVGRLSAADMAKLKVIIRRNLGLESDE